jgi:1,2-phenylacetyl-CoA epoxidase catalytic subunit
VYIRDSVMHTLEIAPDVKTQQALLQQVQDEHNHATWIINLLNKRKYDPRILGKTPSRGYEMFWDFLMGRQTRAAHSKDPFNFLNVVAITQLVNERLFGLRATAVFAENIAPYDEEVAVLYGDKIRKDEVFHTLNLPEMILKKHATSLEAQQAVREGVECSKIFLKIISDEMKGLQTRNYDSCRI